ncbi:MAG TPA: tRNA (adenosine(37)-N6)-threonylcarbamoyltransferase complex dimerization subunit type 1 TsaB [Candidatus Omnitrophota bacterium]|nr:tRNA (adenosine(37)-N6)-threonylcarbamoyltransferase complex dimerization subunit type 1 TsaB [Candidatus Omnitrophota bacterium]
MNILALDTSLRDASLAVAKDGKVVRTKNYGFKKDLSAKLSGYIESILKAASLTIKKVDVIVVGLGPGSFTGLRVGLATAKAISYSLRIPIIGVASLDAIAYGVPQEDAQICVILDARRNLLYACRYEKKGGQLKRVDDYMLVPMEELLKTVKGQTVFVGDGINIGKERVLKHPGATLAAEKYGAPQAKHLIALASSRIAKKDFDEAATLVPIYLYAEDCQVVNR